MQCAGVLEVVTPALSESAVTDPHIDSVQAGDGFLHTSPEFPMKRLLAAYAVDIYQLATVFREGEQGRFHNREFTLLEWYRCGFDQHALMDDVSALLQQLWEADGRPWHTPDTVAYRAMVKKNTGISLDAITAADVQTFFEKHNRSYPASLANDLDAALDLLFDEFVLPEFATDRATFLTDYPVSQAALARIGTDAQGNAVAQRFELYWGTLELANGFHELTDATEQRARFDQDQIKRQQMGKTTMPIDQAFLEGLQHGLPECAGVALGIDRLLMLLTGATNISDVMAFDGSRA